MYRINLDIRYVNTHPELKGFQFSEVWDSSRTNWRNTLAQRGRCLIKVLMTDVSFSTDRVKNHIQKGKLSFMKKLMLKTTLIWRYKLSAETTLGIRYIRDTHPELKGFQSCLGYGTPDKQTEGIRGLKEEGDCLQLTIDRKRPSILLTVSFLSSRLDEEG